MKRLIASLLFVAACSSETPVATTSTEASKPSTPPPTAEQARELVANAPELAEYEFTNAAISIPVAESSMSEPTRKNARELADAGWIEFDGGEVWLNEKSRGDKRFVMRDNGILDVVPLARKELVAVSGVRTNPDGSPAVDFTWRWKPNEIGSVLKTGPTAERYAAEQQATATLIWDGEKWSVLQITSR
jgi:hypothetical protein